LGRDALEQLVKLELFGGVQAGRRLVEQQQRRMAASARANLDQALMA